jgi:gliding motility-associated protein GldE
VKEPPSYTLLINIFSDWGLYSFSFVGIILLTLSVVISASETAYFSITAQDLDKFKVGQDKRDKLIANLLGRPRLLLVSLIVLKTLMYVSTITFSSLLIANIPGQQIIVGLSILIGNAILIASFGEIVGKVYGASHRLPISRLTVYPWTIWVEMLKPFSIFLIKMTGLIEKKFNKNGGDASGGDLNQALELVTESTITSEGDKGFLRGIMNFGTLTVKEVMSSRDNISAIDSDMDFHTLIDYINQTGFARIPVFKKTIDTISGVLYTKDLLPFIKEGKNYAWQHLIRPGFFVSESKKISSLLRDFQEKHVHMAIAVNEARVTVGLVTLEDLVEEIIGNIKVDPIDPAMTFEKLDDKTYVFDGKVLVSEFYKVLPVNARVFNVDVENKSLSEALLKHFSKFPQPGDRFMEGPLIFVIESVDHKKIKRLRVQINEKV